jgi:hypothetical protein
MYVAGQVRGDVIIVAFGPTASRAIAVLIAGTQQALATRKPSTPTP